MVREITLVATILFLAIEKNSLRPSFMKKYFIVKHFGNVPLHHFAKQIGELGFPARLKYTTLRCRNEEEKFQCDRHF